MEHARTLEAVGPLVPVDESPLAHARLHRQLTVDEAARRANVSAEEIQWLEEGRLYRFPTPDRAVMVSLLYATALELDHREALELAGLPAPPLPPARWKRLAAAGVFFAVVVAATLAVVLAKSSGSHAVAAGSSNASTLPPPWAIKVDVLNG